MKVRSKRDALVAEIRGLIDILLREDEDMGPGLRRAFHDIKSWKWLRALSDESRNNLRAYLLDSVEDLADMPLLSKLDNTPSASLVTAFNQKVQH